MVKAMHDRASRHVHVLTSSITACTIGVALR